MIQSVHTLKEHFLSKITPKLEVKHANLEVKLARLQVKYARLVAFVRHQTSPCSKSFSDMSTFATIPLLEF